MIAEHRARDGTARGAKPYGQDQHEMTGSWRAPALRLEAARVARRDRARARPRGPNRCRNPEKVIGLLPGYDPWKGAGAFEFDPKRARAAVRWIQGHLTHVEGEWAAGPDPLLLRPWQQGIICNLFGWYHRKTGLRRFRQALIYIPRKNGKSILTASIANYVASEDGEPGCKVFCAAAERGQARLIFDTAAGQIRQDEHLADRARVYDGYGSIVYDGGQAVIKALSSESKTKHGLNAHLVIIDELHTQPSRKLVDVLVTSTGSRRQPLIVYLTTADYEQPSICNQKYDYACGVRDGRIDDLTFLPVIYEAEESDDWTSPRVWRAANPNYGVSVKVQYLEDMCRKAQEEPEFENEFKRLHLNIRTRQVKRVVPMEMWRASGGRVDPQSLAGKRCWGGLDIGSTSDLNAFSLIFPHESGQRIDVLWWFWSPMDTAEKRQRKDSVPYVTWGRQGWITLTEGNETDYGRIRRDIGKIGETYPIVDIAADRAFQGAQLCQDLVYDGFDVVPFSQGMLSMTAPTKQFLRLVNLQQIRHGDNPVAAWMAANLAVRTDEEGNVRPAKDRSPDKIDGMVTLIMSIGRYEARERGDPQRSVYEDRGALEF